MWQNALAHKLKQIEILLNLIQVKCIERLESKYNHLNLLLLYVFKLGQISYLFLLFRVFHSYTQSKQEQLVINIKKCLEVFHLLLL